jgi:GNAT superfamily N-acetyltransferase
MSGDESFEIRIGNETMDFGAVTSMLADAYWCKGISREEVEESARNSAIVVGAFTEDGQQVGYARAISDKLRFAYILDVIVLEPYRGKGAAKAMMDRMIHGPEMSRVYQWLLITRDAHKFYEKLGFVVTSRPLDWMEIRKPRPSR